MTEGRHIGRIFLVAGIAGVVLIIIAIHAILNKKSFESTSPLATSDYTGYCGKELAEIKQLRDPAASKISFKPIQTSIAHLVSLSAPKADENRVRAAGEEKTYTIKAKLDKFKAEPDSDIHLDVRDGKGHHMIVEFIAPQCDTGKPHASQIAQARSDLLAECGIPSSQKFTSLRGKTAIITGVAFFDFIHGQYDVAPNGIELHPVIAFKGCSPPSE